LKNENNPFNPKSYESKKDNDSKHSLTVVLKNHEKIELDSKVNTKKALKVLKHKNLINENGNKNNFIEKIEKKNKDNKTQVMISKDFKKANNNFINNKANASNIVNVNTKGQEFLGKKRHIW